ncbi:MAG: hypothetical protein MUE81_11215 [Thermoflexibacter sp.]|jgi:hypothetical protein|nr:hypothetical protein [Thermoflexibacter sp.]
MLQFHFSTLEGEDIIFDANALNKPFYYELLYILGLEEYRGSGENQAEEATRSGRTDRVGHF